MIKMMEIIMKMLTDMNTNLTQKMDTCYANIKVEIQAIRTDHEIFDINRIDLNSKYQNQQEQNNSITQDKLLEDNTEELKLAENKKGVAEDKKEVVEEKTDTAEEIIETAEEEKKTLGEKKDFEDEKM
jgi:hypothetical protein